MAVWVVRAGKLGERQEFALDKGLAVIGWPELQNLSTVKSREELNALFGKTYPDVKPGTIASWVGQVWAFKSRIQIGDLVVLPLKGRASIAVGKVSGNYKHLPELPPDARHARAVQWIAKDLPRSAFDDDLLYSLGSLQTVCQIQRNNAEERIRALAEGGTPKFKKVATSTEEAVEGEDSSLDLERISLDQIRKYIGRKFVGHGLAQLVSAVLESQEYTTNTSNPGRDGGVDILAGRGAMGFDEPRLCVQVKSEREPIDVKVLRELRGVMDRFGARQGLLVSWSGFKETTEKEARDQFFGIRLWDSDDLIKALFEGYDRLPEDIRSALSLKRIWIRVPEPAEAE